MTIDQACALLRAPDEWHDIERLVDALRAVAELAATAPATKSSATRALDLLEKGRRGGMSKLSEKGLRAVEAVSKSALPA